MCAPLINYTQIHVSRRYDYSTGVLKIFTRKAVFPAISTAVSPALANLLTQPVRRKN